jgi:PTH1 family peptidyl-tRNA hydrolase
MKLVVGLGNPGREYEWTRHNVGFEVLDVIGERQVVQWEMAPRGIEALIGRWRKADVVLAKPLTFMNLSGTAIVALLQFYKVDLADLLVIVDEVQLETGRIRIRPSGSAGGHNGLKSIIGSLGTEAFPRLRIGVGRGDNRRDLADHVLAKFDADERPVVADAVARTADAAEVFIAEGSSAAMNRFNRKDDKTEENGKPDTGDGKPGTGNRQATDN